MSLSLKENRIPLFSTLPGATATKQPNCSSVVSGKEYHRAFISVSLGLSNTSDRVIEICCSDVIWSKHIVYRLECEDEYFVKQDLDGMMLPVYSFYYN